MEKIPNWARLWRDMVGLNDRWQEPSEAQEAHWKLKARSFSENIEKRWAKSDSSRDFLVTSLRRFPGSTLIDIGAGTGAWVVLAAPHAARVTAVDQSAAMLDVLGENMRHAGIGNVDVIQGSWPDVDAEPHDFSLCSHAMYGVADLHGFISKMVTVTRRTCFLVIRAPKIDGLMAEFARLVLGHPHDSPNFVIAYNVLVELGIYANVLMEDTGWWPGWENDSLEDALADVKRRLGLKHNPAYDEVIYRRLGEELVYREGKYIWPQGVRSVLVYWHV